MSKLVDCLAAVCALLSIWPAILYHFIEFEIINEYRSIVCVFSVTVVVALGVYSGVTVLWRVFNFSDCNEEAFKLQTEIKEARGDLVAKSSIFQ